MSYIGASGWDSRPTDTIPARDLSGGGGRHRRSGGRRVDPLWILLGSIVVVVAVAFLVILLVPSGDEQPTTPVAAPTTTPVVETTMGTVSKVLDADVVQVDTRSGSAPVRILGVLPMTAADCGYQAAIDHANERLVGQPVTLVPDPTVSDRDAAGHRRAYVVLRSQQSYTDDVIANGLMEPSPEALWYFDVFAREASEARDAGKGLYGDPCNVK